MTAQPEVVWVLVEEENGEPVYWLETEAFAGYTPYVSQASLTTALAERNEAVKKMRIAEMKSRGSLVENMCPDHRDKQAGKPCLACTIETLTRERDEALANAVCVETAVREHIAGMQVERDKLAKALERANTYLAEVGHCLSLAEAKRLAKAFLTAQAAQGEKG